jgi:hypothetical protein
LNKTDFDSIFEELPKRKLLRIHEVATFFGVTQRTIYSWYPEKLQGTNINGIIRIYRQSVIDLVISNEGKKKSDETIKEVEKKVATIAKDNPDDRKRRRSWVRSYKN